MDEERSKLFVRATGQEPLKHPTARAFNSNEWLEALSNIETPSERDLTLFTSAMWFGLQISRLRTVTRSVLEGLDRRTAYLLALGQVNREYTVLSKRIVRHGIEESRKEITELDAVARRKIQAGMPGNEMSSDDVTDAAVDTLPVWLHYANGLPLAGGPPDLDLKVVGTQAMRLFSIENGLNHLWQQALWADWRLTREERLRFVPADKVFETMRHAWLWRQQALMTQYGMLTAAGIRQAKAEGLKIPPILATTVVGLVQQHGQKRRFKLGRQAGTAPRQIAHYMENAVLENSYLGMFLDATLPELGLSCKQLSRAWFVLQDAASSLAANFPERTVIGSSTAGRWGLECRRNMLVDCLVKCCGISVAEADETLKFFTYDAENGQHFRKGLWAMPLVKLPASQTLAVCLPSLMVGSPIRRVEQWLERGGLGDQLSGSARGGQYEAWARRELVDAITSNHLLNDADVLKTAFSPSDRTIGDIDAVVRLGTLIFVCEIKCFLTPADPIEQYRYQRKLRRAAFQLLRKRDWLEANPVTLACKLDLRPEVVQKTRLVPLILVNQGYGFSQAAEGVRVVDFSFFKRILGDGDMVIDGAFRGSDGSTATSNVTFYSSQEEAENRIESLLACPPTLSRFVKRVSWYEKIFPTAEGGLLHIDAASFASADADHAAHLEDLAKALLHRGR